VYVICGTQGSAEMASASPDAARHQGQKRDKRRKEGKTKGRGEGPGTIAVDDRADLAHVKNNPSQKKKVSERASELWPLLSLIRPTIKFNQNSN
jgi:hypothetical protein